MRHVIPLYRFLLLLSISIVLVTCEKNPTSPNDSGYLVASQYHNLNFQLVNYNLVQVTQQSGNTFKSRNIAAIGVGTKDSSIYHELGFARSQYDQSSGSYLITFDITVHLDSTEIDAPMTVRYYFADSTFDDVDTSVALYKYPYTSSQVVVGDSVLRSVSPWIDQFQDVARLGNKLYLHPFAAQGLFEYDLTSHSIRSLLDYGAGDHLAADSVFVFCDVNHNSIRRYNILKDSVDLVFWPFPQSYSYGFSGMTTYNHKLYVSFYNVPALYTLTYGGTILDSLPPPNMGYYMTIYQDILYSVGPSDGQLSRFDLNAGTSLPPLKSPGLEMGGIKLYKDQLYYCDFFKGLVGVMPISDLRQ